MLFLQLTPFQGQRIDLSLIHRNTPKGQFRVSLGEVKGDVAKVVTLVVAKKRFLLRAVRVVVGELGSFKFIERVAIGPLDLVDISAVAAGG